ncbi:MAG: hypothetical protein AAF730_12175, partial [Bacteroidota bacterium]
MLSRLSDPIQRSCLVVVLALLGTATAQAQGTAQVGVLGVPPTLDSPFIADLVEQIDRGVYPVQFIYSSPSAGAASFSFRITLALDGETLLDIETIPETIAPGAYLRQQFDDAPRMQIDGGVDAVLEQFNGEIASQVERNGALPEGRYTLTIAPIVDPSSLILTLASTVTFNVRLAEPPVLFAPNNGVDVMAFAPIFTWVPVLASPQSMVEYSFLLVELLDGQDPDDGLDGNRPHAETVTAETTLPYLPEFLELTPGARYAWRVTARDANGLLALAEDGESEAWTFTFTPPTILGQTNFPLQLTGPLNGVFVDASQPTFEWTGFLPPDFNNDLGPAQIDLTPLSGLFGGTTSALPFSVALPASANGSYRLSLSEAGQLQSGTRYSWEITRGPNTLSLPGVFNYTAGGGGITPIDTPPQPALAVQLEAPSNGATVQRLAPRFAWTTTQPLAFGASQKLVIRPVGGGFDQSIDIAPTGGTSYSHTLTAAERTQLEPGTSYGWYVEIDGQPASNTQRFVYRPRLQASLLVPTQGQVIAQDDIPFSWQLLLPSGQFSADVDVLVWANDGDTPARFPVDNSGLVGAVTLTKSQLASAGVPTSGGQRLSWTVALRNSDVQALRTGTFSFALPQLAGVSPLGVAQDLQLTFGWSGAQLPSGGGFIRFKPTNGSRGGILSVGRLASGRYTTSWAEVTLFRPGTEYEWQVLGADGQPISNTSTFTYRPGLSATLTGLANGATVSGADLTLNWNAGVSASEAIQAGLEAKLDVVAPNGAVVAQYDLGDVGTNGGQGAARIATATLPIVQGQPYTLRLVIQRRDDARWQFATDASITDVRFLSGGTSMATPTNPIGPSAMNDANPTFTWTFSGALPQGGGFVEVSGATLPRTYRELISSLALGRAVELTVANPFARRLTPGQRYSWRLLDANNVPLSTAVSFTYLPAVSVRPTLTGLSTGQTVEGTSVQLDWAIDLKADALFLNTMNLEAILYLTPDDGDEVQVPLGEVTVQPRGSATIDVEELAVDPAKRYTVSLGLRSGSQAQWRFRSRAVATNVGFKSAASNLITLTGPRTRSTITGPALTLSWSRQNAPSEAGTARLTPSGGGTPVTLPVGNLRDRELVLTAAQVMQLQPGTTYRWHLRDNSGQKVSTSASFVWEPELEASISGLISDAEVTAQELDLSVSVRAPAGMTGLVEPFLTVVSETDAQAAQQQARLIKIQLDDQNQARVALKAASVLVDQAATYSFGVALVNQQTGWQLATGPLVERVRMGSRAPSSTVSVQLQAPAADSLVVALQPTFQWAFSGTPSIQSLAVLVRRADAPGGVPQRWPVANPSAQSTSFTPTAQQVVAIPMQRELEGTALVWSLEVNGHETTARQAFRYRPEFDFTAVHPVNVTVGQTQRFQWRGDLPASYAALGLTRTLFAYDPDRLDAIWGWPDVGATEETIDLGEQLPAMFGGTLGWTVGFVNPATGWVATGDDVPKVPFGNAVTLVSPANAASVTDILPTFTWRYAEGFTTAPDVTLVIRKYSGSNQGEWSIPVPIENGVLPTSYTLTIDQAFALSNVDGDFFDWQIRIGDRVASPGVEPFKYRPVFEAQLTSPQNGADLAGTEQVFRWSLNLPPSLQNQDLTPWVVFIDRGTGEAAGYQTTLADSELAISQQMMEGLRPLGLPINPGDVLLWDIRLRNATNTWEAESSQGRTARYAMGGGVDTVADPLADLLKPASGETVPVPHVAFAWRYDTPTAPPSGLRLHIDRQDASGSYDVPVVGTQYQLDPTDFALAPQGLYAWYLTSNNTQVTDKALFRYVPQPMVALEQPVGGSTVTRAVPELTWRYQHLPERIDPDRLTGNEPISVQYFAEHIDSGRFLAWKAPLPAVSLDGNDPSAGYSLLPRTGELRPDADRSEVPPVNESALAPGRYRVWASFVPTGVFAGYDLANLKSSPITFTYQPQDDPSLVTLTAPAGGDVVPVPHVAFSWETPAQAMPNTMIHIERQDAAGSFSATADLGRYDLDPSDFMLVPGGIYQWHLSSDGQRVSEQLIFRHVPSSMVALEQPVSGSTVTSTVPELTWRYQHLPERIDPDRLTGNEPISVQYFAEHIDSGRFLAWKAPLPAVSLDG